MAVRKQGIKDSDGKLVTPARLAGVMEKLARTGAREATAEALDLVWCALRAGGDELLRTAGQLLAGNAEAAGRLRTMRRFCATHYPDDAEESNDRSLIILPVLMALPHDGGAIPARLSETEWLAATLEETVAGFAPHPGQFYFAPAFEPPGRLARLQCSEVFRLGLELSREAQGAVTASSLGTPIVLPESSTSQVRFLLGICANRQAANFPLQVPRVPIERLSQWQREAAGVMARQTGCRMVVGRPDYFFKCLDVLPEFYRQAALWDALSSQTFPSGRLIAVVTGHVDREGVPQEIRIGVFEDAPDGAMRLGFVWPPAQVAPLAELVAMINFTLHAAGIAAVRVHETPLALEEVPPAHFLRPDGSWQRWLKMA